MKPFYSKGVKYLGWGWPQEWRLSHCPSSRQKALTTCSHQCQSRTNTWSRACVDVLSMNFVQVCCCEFGLSLLPRLFVLQPCSVSVCYRASYRGYRLYCPWSSNLAYLIDWLISFPHFHTLWNSTCRSPGDSITWPDEFHSNCSHTWHLHSPREPHSHTEHTANIHPGVAESQGLVRFVFSPASWTLGILRHVKAPLTWPNSAPSKCHLQNMLQLCSVFLFTSFYLNPGVQLQPALILLASVFLQTHSRCESIGLRSTFVGSPLSGFSMFVMVLCPACGATPCHFNPFQNIWSLNSSESILRWHKHGVLSQP